MRIGWFTNGFPVSSEPFIALQAAELVARGHDLHIFGLSNYAPSQPTSSARVQSLLEGRYSTAHWPAQRLARLRAAGAATLRTAQQVGITRAPMMRPLNFRRTWLDLSSVFHAELVAGKQPFDILHCQFATLGEHVIKMLDAGLLTGRLIVHFRGYDITEVVQAYGVKAYDHLWPRAHRFIANCDHFRDLAIQLGCPRGKIDVVGSGIDLDSFVYRAPLAIGAQPIRLIAVGRLTRRKGFHTLIQALAALVRADADCHLTLVGAGPERQALEQLANACGVGERVCFAGLLTHSEISERLADSHIFVAPSETCPKGGADAPTNTIKEAMAVGVPVCGTRHGGIPELVEEGSTGVLAREGDPEDLSRAILRLIDRAPVWPLMTRQARARIEERYEIGAVTDKLHNSYARAMECGL